MIVLSQTAETGKIGLKTARRSRKGFAGHMRENFALYTMVLPGFALILLFCYFPMYGVVMAFESFKPALGFFKSPYVGFAHFIHLFQDPYFFTTFKNTFILGVYTLAFGFPAPILLALMFNELKSAWYKKVTQTISYLPYFLSMVIVVGIMKDMLSVNDGVVNILVGALGHKKIDFFTSANWFRTIYIASDLWQKVGYNSIIYLAAIAGINPEIYEAARIDGASRVKQAVYITLPSIAPTVIILFIFSIGGIFGSDFQKILLIYHPSTYATSDVISTYVYRVGIEGANPGYGTAVGLFLSVLSVAMLVIANYLAKRFGETSLW